MPRPVQVFPIFECDTISPGPSQRCPLQNLMRRSIHEKAAGAAGRAARMAALPDGAALALTRPLSSMPRRLCECEIFILTLAPLRR